MYEEWTAWIPKNPHDSWSQDVTTRDYPSEKLLMESLEAWRRLPGGLEGVRIYCRIVHPNMLCGVLDADGNKR